MTRRVNFFWSKVSGKEKKSVMKGCLHGREGVQRGKGSWSDAGDLVVVERQQTDRAEAGKGAVVDAGDLVAPQHSGKKKNHENTKKLL